MFTKEEGPAGAAIDGVGVGVGAVGYIREWGHYLSSERRDEVVLG